MIGDQDAASRVAVMALALGCAGTGGGIVALKEVLSQFDGSTSPFKALADFLEAQPVPLPSVFTQDETSREATIRNISIGTGTYNEGSIQATIEGGIGVVGSTIQGNITYTYNDYRQNSKARSPLVPPAAPEHFAGREHELKELAEWLGQSEGKGGGVALTALHGQGGIGKTTLARQVVYNLYKSKQFGTVLWVEVGSGFDPWLTLRRWSSYCGITIDDIHLDWDVTAGQVQAAFAKVVEGLLLVVFDDVWPEAVKEVRRLLKAIPMGATGLLTSRDVTVGTALAAHRIDLDTLPVAEAVALLQEYLDNKELAQEGLEELAGLLRGHTLAFTLAAKRLNMEMSGAEMALPRHLAQYVKGLPAGIAIKQLKVFSDELDESREDSLKLALAYSYDTLKSDQQARFRALGALAYDQPFHLNLLLGLWDLEPLPPHNEDISRWEEAAETAQEWSNDLCKLSLMEPANKAELGQGWYQQHPILRSYALALLKSDEKESLAVHNH